MLCKKLNTKKFANLVAKQRKKMANNAIETTPSKSSDEPKIVIKYITEGTASKDTGIFGYLDENNIDVQLHVEVKITPEHHPWLSIINNKVRVVTTSKGRDHDFWIDEQSCFEISRKDNYQDTLVFCLWGNWGSVRFTPPDLTAFTFGQSLARHCCQDWNQMLSRIGL